MSMFRLNDEPLLIVGMGSSGTRLLVEILEHCGIFMGGALSDNEPKEPTIFYTANKFVDKFRYEETLPADWEDVVAAKAADIAWFASEVLPMRYVEAGYAGGPWGAKDPRNTFVMPLYLNEFPNCRLIHLVRDGRDVALSKITKDWPQHLRLTDTDKLDRWFSVWQNHVAVASSYRARVPPGRFFEMRYEDLCLARAPVVKLLAGLVNRQPSYVSSVIRAKAYRNRIGKWKAKPEESIFAKNNRLLLSYGYTA